MLLDFAQWLLCVVCVGVACRLVYVDCCLMFVCVCCWLSFVVRCVLFVVGCVVHVNGFCSFVVVCCVCSS